MGFIGYMRGFQVRSGFALVLALVFTALPCAGSEPDVELGRTPAILERVRKIADTLTSSEYSHVTRVNEAAGSYVFDCSGFVAWVLRRTAAGANLDRGDPETQAPAAYGWFGENSAWILSAKIAIGRALR